MSRVYFHSIDDTSELRGSERAWAGHITNQMGIGALGISWVSDDWKRIRDSLYPAPSYVDTAERLVTVLRVNAHDMNFRLPDGRMENAWQVILNTCIDTGSDGLCLLARVHGQCELHCFVEGEHRVWLAEIIKRSRRVGLFRANMGWEEVAAHLADSAKHPVVMSYSVCAGFPNKRVAGLSSEGDAWYDRPHEERWDLCMKAIRAPGTGLRIGPDTLTTVGFGSGMNAFEVIAALHDSPTTAELASRGRLGANIIVR